MWCRTNLKSWISSSAQTARASLPRLAISFYNIFDVLWVSYPILLNIFQTTEVFQQKVSPKIFSLTSSISLWAPSCEILIDIKTLIRIYRPLFSDPPPLTFLNNPPFPQYMCLFEHVSTFRASYVSKFLLTSLNAHRPPSRTSSPTTNWCISILANFGRTHWTILTLEEKKKRHIRHSDFPVTSSTSIEPFRKRKKESRDYMWPQFIFPDSSTNSLHSNNPE